jgi:hypothetical protein
MFKTGPSKDAVRRCEGLVISCGDRHRGAYC